VLGLPAYGRTFALDNPKIHGLNAKSSKSGQTSGNYTQTPGFLSYYEICQLKKKYNWTTVWQSQSKSHYMYRDNDWISYDDIKSFHLRVNFNPSTQFENLIKPYNIYFSYRLHMWLRKNLVEYSFGQSTWMILVENFVI
jgi:hypothetical protein